MLVGRDRERAVLHDRLTRAAEGTGHTVLISGEPGIGKSALLSEFVEYARGQDALVLTGRAIPGTGPYRSLTEALMVPVRAGLVTESAALRPFRSALGRILPGWATAAVPEPGIDPVVLLGEGVLRLLLAVEAPVRVLALDDLQHADPDTLAILEYLAPALTQLPILLVAGQGDWPAMPALNRLSTLPGATRLPLARLTATEVADWVAVQQSTPAEVRAAVVERAEGLPLVMAELVTDVTGRSEAFPTVPESLAALVQARLAVMTPGERQLLTAAAVLELSPADSDVVPNLVGADPVSATAGWSRGVELNLLIDEGDELRWRHGLIRESVAASMPLGERRGLRRRAAELMLARQTDEADAAAAGWLVAAGEPQRAAEIWLRLARRALTGGGLRSAEDLLRQAEVFASPAAVAVLQVERLTLEGRVDAALDLGVAALDAARFDEHAELCLHLARAAVTAGDWGRADDFVARAGRPELAQSLILLADSAHGAGRVAEADRLAAAAVTAARAESAELLCEALCVRGRIRRLTDPAESRASFRAAAQIASEHGFKARRVEALLGLGTLELLADEASPTLVIAQEAAVEIGRLGQAGQVEILLADHALVCDGPQAVVAPATALAETGAVLRLPVFSFLSEVLLATRDALTGDTKAMGERISRLGDLTRLPPDLQSYPQATKAMAAVMAGNLAEAQRLLDAAAVPLLEHGSSAPLLHYGLWVVVSARTAGPDEMARAELRRRPGQLRPAHRGALAYADAIVAGRQGEREAATRAYAAGDALLAPVPWWHRFLRLLTLEAAVADGWGTPVPVLRGDLATYEQAGETELTRICRDLLRRAGAPTRRGRGDAAVPPALRAIGVTSREVDVLRLVAGGLTNAAISERLFLSPRTVETHVTSLLAKSGTANRQELRDWFRALTP